jgi:ubiquinone/menaquinone biosynthesis C-methylase UbiE
MTKNVNWDTYAQVYDLMAYNNPAYQDIFQKFSTEIRQWDIKPNDIFVELGAGTGNYSTYLAEVFPYSQVLHFDSNPIMNEYTQIKAQKKHITNIQIITKDIKDINFFHQTISAVICVYALYTFPEPKKVIKKIFEWIKPNGYVFACDLGRILNLFDWSKYLFKALCYKHGILQALSIFYKGRAIAKQNRLIVSGQKSGKYWTHTHDEFCNEFKEVGFQVISSFESYRRYSDIVICKKSI